MEIIGLDQKVKGMSMVEYMANLIEENEASKLEVERVKNSNNTLKQIHNNYNVQIAVEQLKIKDRELKIKEKEVGINAKDDE